MSRHCARRERPRRRRAAEERDELAPFQLIELHSVPVRQGRIEDIELARISQEGNDLQPVSRPRGPPMSEIGVSNPWLVNFSVRQFSVTVRTT